MKTAKYNFIITVALILTCSAQAGNAATITKKNIEGQPSIVITGEIFEGDETKFLSLAKNMPEATILLESEGGDIKPALDIGRAIRKNGYTTLVMPDRECASACALIWAAGKERLSGETALIGFHAGSRIEEEAIIEDGVGNALIGSYLARLGLEDDFIEIATTAVPEEMLYLDTKNPGAEGISYKIYAFGSVGLSHNAAKPKVNI